MKHALIILFGLFTLELTAQTSIAGKVITEKGKPIAFAHVYNKSSSMGQVSDINGKFSLVAKKGDTVIFSFIGYQTDTLFISSIHLSTYLKVTLPENPLELPSITIYADNYYKVPLNIEGVPMYMEGISVDPNKEPIKPGQLVQGTSPGVGGIPGGGVTLEGPITYFSREEREKRQTEAAQEESAQIITYQSFVAQDSIKDQLMYMYDIDSSQYARIIIRLNRQFPGVQRADTSEEVWHWVIRFFNDQVPVVKAFDMHQSGSKE